MQVLRTISIRAAMLMTVGLFGAPLWAQDTQLQVDNKTDDTITIKKTIENTDGSSKSEDVGEVKKGQTANFTLPADTDLEFFNGNKRVGINKLTQDQLVTIRKPGLEFAICAIKCTYADDEGAANTVEFNGKLQVKVYPNGGDEKSESALTSDPKHIYVENLHPDNGILSNFDYRWTFDVPAEKLDKAVMQFVWTETWEEDNASSSQDDTLYVSKQDTSGTENNSTRTKLKTAPIKPPVIQGNNISGQFFHIWGTEAGNEDAKLDIYYSANAIKSFEVSNK